MITLLRTQPAAAVESAVPRCGSPDAMRTLLRDAFGERKVAHGLSLDGALMEVFAGERDTYTVVKTSPAGMSCIIDLGIAWQAEAVPAPIGPAAERPRIELRGEAVPR